MRELDLKIFGARLKKIAKTRFGSVGNFGEKLGMKNASNYINGTREMGLNIINNLYELGIDINELLDDEGKNKESKEMLEKNVERMNLLELDNLKLKAMLFDMSVEKKESDKKIEVLLSQIVTLDKASKMKRDTSP